MLFHNLRTLIVKFQPSHEVRNSLFDVARVEVGLTHCEVFIDLVVRKLFQTLFGNCVKPDLNNFEQLVKIFEWDASP